MATTLTTPVPSANPTFAAFLNQMRDEAPRAEFDPALQCTHGVSLYRDCPPCGL